MGRMAATLHGITIFSAVTLLEILHVTALDSRDPFNWLIWCVCVVYANGKEMKLPIIYANSNLKNLKKKFTVFSQLSKSRRGR